jgi:hypothetical protein
MANKQNPAGEGGACENSQLNKRDASQHTSKQPRDQVVGTISKNQRESIRVSLRTFDDRRQIDIRVFKNVHGADIGTPQGCTVKPARLRSLIEILERAEDAAKAEGLV